LIPAQSDEFDLTRNSFEISASDDHRYTVPFALVLTMEMAADYGFYLILVRPELVKKLAVAFRLQIPAYTAF
jgi:hypothetical protein